MLAVTKGRFVVVEYTLEFVKALGNDRRAAPHPRAIVGGRVELNLGTRPAGGAVSSTSRSTPTSRR
jgi:hypothetical protein